MRIAGQDTTNNARRTETSLRSSEVSQGKSAEETGSSNEVSSSDRVELSSQARTIQRVREAAQQAPEVREDRIAQAQQSLQNGTLNLQSAALAEKLLQDTLPR